MFLPSSISPSIEFYFFETNANALAISIISTRREISSRRFGIIDQGYEGRRRIRRRTSSLVRVIQARWRPNLKSLAR